MVKSEPLQTVGSFRIALPAHDWTWSEALFEILGVAESADVEPSTNLLLEHLHEDDRDAVRQLLDDVIATGRPAAVWHRVAGPDGGLRQLVTSAVGVTGPAGVVEQVTGQVVDITEPLRLTTSREVDEALQMMSQSRPTIDQAKGALMLTYAVDEETAFALLREYSQHLNLKVRDLARSLIEAAQQPGGWSPGTRSLLDRLVTQLGESASKENPGA